MICPKKLPAKYQWIPALVVLVSSAGADLSDTAAPSRLASLVSAAQGRRNQVGQLGHEKGTDHQDGDRQEDCQR